MFGENHGGREYQKRLGTTVIERKVSHAGSVANSRE
jgi:hypothetical protein